MSNKTWKLFLEKLNSPLMRKGEYTLDHVKKFYDALGRPGEELKIIHVAGTNAKGTVTYKLAKMLELSGYKTGMFISPHQFSWKERVSINGQLISQEECSKFVELNYRLEKELGTDLTFFEFFTMMAYNYFRQEKVDAAVIEVGLGGRLDATNVISKSLLSLITSISLDHTNALGNNEDLICEEKCGIIKPHCPVLIGPQVPLHVVRRFAEERHAPLYVSQIRGKDFTEENAGLIRKAAEILSSTYTIKNEALEEALSSAHNLPCRLQPLQKKLLAPFPFLESVHFDIGHNPDAVLKTLLKFNQMVDMRKTVIVYGCKVLKDFKTCVSQLLAFSPLAIYLVQPRTPGHKSGIIQSDLIKQDFIDIEKVIRVAEGDIAQTLAHITRQPDVKHVLVIGSFTLMRESRRFFGIEDPQDE